MRTRNAYNPKPAAAKKTPPARKSVVKAPSSGSVTPKAAETKSGTATTTKQAKTTETKPQESAVEEVKVLADAAMVTPVKKRVVSAMKTVLKKKAGKSRTPTSRKAVLAQTSKSQNSPCEEVDGPEENVGEFKQEENTMDVEEPVVDTVTGRKEEETVLEDGNEESAGHSENLGNSVKQKESVVEVGKSNDKNGSGFEKKEEEQGSAKKKEAVPVLRLENGDEEDLDPEEEEFDGIERVDEKGKSQIVTVDKVGNLNEELRGEDDHPHQDEYGGYEGYEYGDQVDYGDHEEEEFAEDDIEEPAEETDILEEERRELKAITNDRRIKKEHEIFVGGLDRDATEEDVKQVFERIGEIVEVRLHKNFSTNKNKGYAFVKFSNKEHAKQALSEMKNPVICGKRCGTAPSEDNDTLFVGNICNTWTKEAIKQKMKDYGVEGVENITLVPDVQNDGLSRGFAFVEFSCHVDAMAAYKRLQKPDVVFGHPERSVKVAFAEPLREPDPEVMAQVKTVFLDGVPPHWNEDQVREQINGYGEIVRIVLARNMSTARRKDYGFVDFSAHEAAVACISGINNKELADGNSKIKLKARLSNPLPKTQAVKGGLCGGFRIGHGGSASFSRFGRGFGRGGHQSSWANFQRGRGFYQHGRGQFNRRHSDYGYGNRHNEFPGRPYFGRGRRGSFRGHYAPGRAMMEVGPSRPNPNRPWHHGPDRGHGEHISYRMQPFSPDEDFDRPFIGRQVDDPYFYDDRGHGVKRPFYAIDHDPDYMGPSRLRPRVDYSEPAIPMHGSRYRDNYGTDSGLYRDDYYGSDYGAYPHYYGEDRSYGGGYYY